MPPCSLDAMHATETVHAEPRSSVDAPNYRVNFWQPTPEGAWSLDAHVLTEVKDVTEALRWVSEHSNGQRFELFVETDVEPVGRFGAPRSSELVRLAGDNPNVGTEIVIGVFREDWVQITMGPGGRSGARESLETGIPRAFNRSV